MARTTQINGGSVGNRTIGGSNTSGVNTFSGTIDRDADADDESVTLTAASGGTVDYTGAFDGNDIVYVTGGGITRYSTTAKTYTGETVITNSSTLQLNASNLLDDGADLTIVSGSTLDLNGNTDETGWVQGAGNISLGAGQLRVNHGSNRTLSGLISGSGTLVKKGLGTYSLTGANTYSGNSFAVGGILQFDVNQNASFTGTLNVGETSGADDAALAIGAAGVTLSNPISVRTGSSGVKYLRANNTSGTATMSGAVTLNNPVTIVATSGGALNISAGGITQNANQIILQNNQTVTLGAITGSGVIEKKSGNGGDVIVTGTIAAGDIWHNDGTIRISSGGDITSGDYYLGSAVHQTDSTLELAVSGADIDRTIEAEDALGGEVKTIRTSVAGTGTISGTVRLDNQDLILSSTNGSTLVLSSTLDLDFDGNNDVYTRGPGDITFSGTLNTGSGASDLFTEGSGTVTVSGNTTGYSYQIEHGSGTLFLNNANALGTSYIDKIKITANNTLLRVGTDIAPAGLGILITNGNHTAAIQVDSGATFTVAAAINDGANTANLTKTGAGSLKLQGVNTIDGTTTVNAGTLHMDTGSTLGPTINVNSGATLKGRGTVGAVALKGATVAPGNSVGTLNVSTAEWGTNSVYEFEINDFAGTYGTDPGWDRQNGSAALTITATSGQPFTVLLKSLAGSVAGNAVNFTNTMPYTIPIATATATSIVGFDSTKFTIDSSSFSNAVGAGTWDITNTATQVQLVFNTTSSTTSTSTSTSSSTTSSTSSSTSSTSSTTTSTSSTSSSTSSTTSSTSSTAGAPAAPTIIQFK